MNTQLGIGLDSETTKLIQNLIAVNIDSQNGLQEAAEHCEDYDARAVFQDLSTQRYQHALELQNIVQATGQTPTEDGTFAGEALRAQMRFRSALGGGTKAMLVEAEREEDRVQAQYEETVGRCVSGPLCDLLVQQLAVVHRGHDQVRDLRDRYKNK